MEIIFARKKLKPKKKMKKRRMTTKKAMSASADIQREMGTATSAKVFTQTIAIAVSSFFFLEYSFEFNLFESGLVRRCVCVCVSLFSPIRMCFNLAHELLSWLFKLFWYIGTTYWYTGYIQIYIHFLRVSASRIKIWTAASVFFSLLFAIYGKTANKCVSREQGGLSKKDCSERAHAKHREIEHNTIHTPQTALENCIKTQSPIFSFMRWMQMQFRWPRWSRMKWNF